MISVNNFIEKLKLFKGMNIMISSDEELNTMFHDIQIAKLTGTNTAIIYGLSGSETDEIE